MLDRDQLDIHGILILKNKSALVGLRWPVAAKRGGSSQFVRPEDPLHDRAFRRSRVVIGPIDERLPCSEHGGVSAPVVPEEVATVQEDVDDGTLDGGRPRPRVDPHRLAGFEHAPEGRRPTLIAQMRASYQIARKMVQGSRTEFLTDYSRFPPPQCRPNPAP